MFAMMQGDSYSLAIELKKADGTTITSSDVANVEISIGWLTKDMQSGVTYSDGLWYFPITQQESFKLAPTYVKAQARVVLSDNFIEGIDLGTVHVLESLSKEVLT